MKTSTVVIIVGILAIVGGLLYWQSSKNRMPGEGMMDESRNEMMMGEEERMMAGQPFSALVRAGNDVRCEFAQGEGDNETSGTIAIADRGERIRGDFMMMQDGKHSEAHMIRTGGWNYIWTAGEPQGMKMQVTAENREKLFESEDGIPEDVRYNCVEGGVEATMFELPKNVQFTDMSAMLKTGANGSVDMQAAQCAACDQAGASRDQCRIALGCE